MVRKSDTDQENTTETNRRRLMKTMSGGVTGTIAASSGLLASTGTTTARYMRPIGGGGSSTSRDDPYDTVPAEVVDHDHMDSTIAEAHSSVTGPKVVDNSISQVNLAVAFPISLNSEDHVTPSVENVTISVEPVSTPGDYDLQNVTTYKQSERTDLDEVVEYAIDTAWSASVGRVLPIPSPWGLIQSDGPDVSQNYAESYIDADFGSRTSVGMKWELDFYVEGGTVPTGDWEFEVTCEADAGLMSTGMYNPGFNKHGEFSQSHDVVITVEE